MRRRQAAGNSSNTTLPRALLSGLLGEWRRFVVVAALVWLPIVAHDALWTLGPADALAVPRLRSVALWTLAMAAGAILVTAIVIAVTAKGWQRLGGRVDRGTLLWLGIFIGCLTLTAVGPHRTMVVAAAGAACLVVAATVRRCSSRRRLAPSHTLEVALAAVAWGATLVTAYGDVESIASVLLMAGSATLGLLVWALVRGGRAGIVVAAPVAGALLPILFLTGPHQAGDGTVPSGPTARHPNVVLFIVDTLRADHTTIGGYERPTTPGLAALCRGRATVYRQAWCAAPSTTPSLKSVWTGRIASTWGLTGAGKDAPPTSAPTLPHTFASAGYDTAIFGANAELDAPGFARGFAKAWIRGGLRITRNSFFLGQVLCRDDFWAALRWTEAHRVHKLDGGTVVEKALSWLSLPRTAPFFTVVHITEPHWPVYRHGLGLMSEELLAAPSVSYVDFLQPPQRVLRPDSLGVREMVGRYDEEVAWADSLFSRFVSGLRGLGHGDDTIVVFLADHGEEYFEHGGFSHGHDVYLEQVHVPLVVLWPSDERFDHALRTVDAPVSLLDIYPTLAALLDLPVDGVRFDGVSLPVFQDEPLAERPPIVTEAYRPGRCIGAVRTGDEVVRLVYGPRVSPLAADDARVYDLSRDPGERRPLPKPDPRLLATAKTILGAVWGRWPDRLHRPVTTPGGPGDEALKQLRALGYLQ